MSDLLTKWLLHYDPIHRGWTPAGIANGVCATNGFGFPRVRGGYNLYRGSSPATATLCVGVAAAGDGTIRPFGWFSQAAGQRYYFALSAIGGGGVAAVDGGRGRPMAVVTTGPDGAAVEPVPPAPRRLAVTPRAGGRFLLQWEHVSTAGFAAVYDWRVYNDAGTGVFNWETPIAALRARGSNGGNGLYELSTAAFGHGLTVQFAVRAATRGGDEEANEVIVSAIADAEGPAAHQVSSCSYGGDE